MLSIVTWVGPVSAPSTQPLYSLTSIKASSYVQYVTLPSGSVSLVSRPRLSTW